MFVACLGCVSWRLHFFFGSVSRSNHRQESDSGAGQSRAACRARVRGRSRESARSPRVPRAHAQGGGPALPFERRDLRRILYSRGRRRRPLRGPRQPFLYQAAGRAQSAPPQPVCGDGKVPAAKAYSDQHLYDALIDAFSMRSFVPSPGVSGHDHFFDTFGKFGGTSHRHAGECLDEIASRAASQNEQYLELMETPDFGHTAMIAQQIGWHEDMNQLRADLLARGLRDDIAVARAARDEAEASRRAIEHCGAAAGSARVQNHDPLFVSGSARLPERNRFSRRRCWASRSLPPIRVSSASTTSCPRTARPPWPTTRCT